MGVLWTAAVKAELIAEMRKDLWDETSNFPQRSRLSGMPLSKHIGDGEGAAAATEVVDPYRLLHLIVNRVVTRRRLACDQRF